MNSKGSLLIISPVVFPLIEKKLAMTFSSMTVHSDRVIRSILDIVILPLTSIHRNAELCEGKYEISVTNLIFRMPNIHGIIKTSFCYNFLND